LEFHVCMTLALNRLTERAPTRSNIFVHIMDLMPACCISRSRTVAGRSAGRWRALVREQSCSRVLPPGLRSSRATACRRRRDSPLHCASPYHTLPAWLRSVPTHASQRPAQHAGQTDPGAESLVAVGRHGLGIGFLTRGRLLRLPIALIAASAAKMQSGQTLSTEGWGRDPWRRRKTRKRSSA
jgi:hypothetical protein